jgi:hypothetical protein
METRSEYHTTQAPPHFALPQGDMKLLDDLQAYFQAYARERPATVALACLAVGFILGWRLKPW